MLNVNGLSFRYRGGEPLLKGVSFSIGAGQCAAVLGNNGAGKSTLMKCVGRLLNANAGSVQLNGSELTQLSHREIAKRVAFVAQSAPRTRLTVYDSVLLGRKPYMKWAFSAEDRAIAENAIAQMQLSGLEERFTDELSGGEQQKVMLARALAQQPELLLLDEPTSSLDLQNQHLVLGLVREICERTGIAAMVIIHDLNLALRFCDRFLMLSGGEICFSGGAEVVNRESIARVYGIPAKVVEIGGRRVVIAD
ncbi:MAG: ABC transporter ATP-binding protein [Candidatus Faecivicinus sp.]|nr:ABC transporter ATP-binding protein [Candidatus Faecivicinus sp.]